MVVAVEEGMSVVPEQNFPLWQDETWDEGFQQKTVGEQGAWLSQTAYPCVSQQY